MSLLTSKSATPDSLPSGDSDALILLLQDSFTRKQPSKLAQLSSEELIAILQQHSDGALIDTLKSKIKSRQTLSDKDFSVLHFVDQLFLVYRNASPLHELICDLVDQLRHRIAIPLIQQDLSILESKHALQQCLCAIQHHTLGWQPEQGRAAEHYIDTLRALVQDIATAENCEALESGSAALHTFFENDLARINKIEQRLRDTEQGRLHSRFARQTATLELNTRMRGRKLPEGVIQFLHGCWLDSLNLALINSSRDSDQWQHMLELTERLIDSFQQSNDELVRAEEISAIGTELKSHTLSLIHNEQILGAQLSVIATEHFKILQGEIPECTPVRLIDEANPLTSAQAKVSKTLIKEVEKIQLGQWFLLHKANQQPHRIQLTMKSEANSQLLFVNHFGLKTETFSYEELAYKLSSRVATAINPASDFDNFVRELINKLFTQRQEKQNRKYQATQAAKQAALAKDNERAEARAKAIAEAALLAEAEKEKTARDNQSSAAQLTVGSLIEFDNGEQGKDQCRLAAKIQSTAKYIFVNRKGEKQEELEYKELLKRLNDGSAKIIHKADHYHDPLANVVESIRKSTGK